MEHTWQQVKEAIAHVSVRHAEIRARYKPLGPDMVFASPYGQLPLDTEPDGVLREFPWMAVDNGAKARALQLMAPQPTRPNKQSGRQKQQDSVTELHNQLGKLTFRGDVNFELRFRNLKHELIWQLQQDPLIDRELTPQTKASIRIVVTTLDQARQAIEAGAGQRSG